MNRPLLVCLHGVESTGKSIVAERLGERLGWPRVNEFGRTYAERHGTDFTMADLLTIARGQAEDQFRAEAAAATAGVRVLLIDTDPLMTAAWARMLFGAAPAELAQYPKADLYLHFAPDTPWVADGTRLFGSAAERARFAAICDDVLRAAGVPVVAIGGDWTMREMAVEAAVRRALAASEPGP